MRLWWATPLVILGVFLAMCVYAYPQADDFTFANSVRDQSYADCQITWYKTWTGRWASSALITGVCSQLDLTRQYWWIPAMAWLITLSSITGLWRAWVPSRAYSGWTYVAVPLMLCAAYALMMPSCSQAIYWLPGAATYQFGLASAMVVGMSAPIAARSRGWRLALVTALGGVCAALAAGANETVLAVQAYALAVVAVLRWTRIVSALPWSWCLIVGGCAALSSAVVVLAPGNATRFAAFPNGRQPWLCSVGAANELLFDVQSWLSNPAILLLALLVATARPRALASLTAALPRAMKRRPSMFLAAWIGTMYASLFPSWWAEGQLVETRVSNITWFIFIVGWPLLIALIACWWRRAMLVTSRMDGEPAVLPGGTRGWLRVCFAVAVLGTANFSQKIADLREVAPLFARQQEQRYEAIAAARAAHETNLTLPEVTAYSSTLYNCDITKDPTDWGNRAFASYFGLQSVRAK